MYLLNLFLQQIIFKSPTLPKTNIASENRVSQKEISSSNHWFSGVMLVSTHLVASPLEGFESIILGWGLTGADGEKVTGKLVGKMTGWRRKIAMSQLMGVYHKNQPLHSSKLTPRNGKWTRIEDVFPIENWDIPVLC